MSNASLASEFDKGIKKAHTLIYGKLYYLRSQNSREVFLTKDAHGMRVPPKKDKDSRKVARLERQPPGFIFYEYAALLRGDQARKGGANTVKTNIFQGRFIGDEYDKKTHAYGMVHGGIYLMRLMHPNWLQRLIGERGVVVVVQIGGNWHYIKYESINAFDRNWEFVEVKNQSNNRKII